VRITPERSLLRVPLLLSLSIALLLTFGVVLAGASQAAPPGNATCSSPQALAVGQVLAGTTTDGGNNYLAHTTNPAYPASVVPADGPDVVYRIEVAPLQQVQVSVNASFRASVYAALNAPAVGIVDPCGSATVATSEGDQVAFVSAHGGPLWLLGPRDDAGGSIPYFVVVDGWTAADHGPFDITASAVPVRTAELLALDQGAVTTLATRLDDIRDDLRALTELLASADPSVRVAFLARSDNPVDALGASAQAAQLGAPVLLTPPTRLAGDTAQALTALNPDLVIVAGGTAAISDGVVAEVGALLPGSMIRRVSGPDRIATAARMGALAAELPYGRPVLRPR
jgi:hypothetical protein